MDGGGLAPARQAGHLAPLPPALVIQPRIAPAHRDQRGRFPARAPAQPRRQHRRAVHAEGLWQRAGRHQRRIALLAIADGHVHAGVLQQIHGPRWRPAEAGTAGTPDGTPQSRHQPQRGEGMRGGDRQRARPAPAAARPASARYPAARHARRRTGWRPSRSGARGALEQRDAHALFERLDLVRHGGGRDRQLAAASLSCAAARPIRRCAARSRAGWRTWLRHLIDDFSHLKAGFLICPMSAKTLNSS